MNLKFTYKYKDDVENIIFKFPNKNHLEFIEDD